MTPMNVNLAVHKEPGSLRYRKHLCSGNDPAHPGHPKHPNNPLS
jgi:hypothetical protein